MLLVALSLSLVVFPRAQTSRTFIQDPYLEGTHPTDKPQRSVLEEYGKLPIGFEPNWGQADSSVKFLTRGNGYALFLTANSVSGNADAFVTQLSADGSTLIYSTYLGGTGFDSAYSLVLNNVGYPVVAGAWASVDSAFTNPMRPKTGPAAAAVDSLLLLRDPFPLLSMAPWFHQGPDRNTRVLIFATDLMLNPGETASAVTVNLIDSNNLGRDIAAEDVRAVPNSNFVQVIFRLPSDLPAGVCQVSIKAHGQTSNTGTFRIAP